MKKIMIGVLIIAFVCISSAAYAVLSENATVSNEDNANVLKIEDNNTNDVNNNIQVKSDNLKEKVAVEKSISLPAAQASAEKVNDQIVKVGKYAHYLKSDALNDRYIICVECGGYVPIGEVTTPLPDASLCYNFMGSFGPSYKEGSISYDEAYKIWVDNGQRIQNDGSEYHIDSLISQEIIDHNTGADEGLQNAVSYLENGSVTAEV